MSRYPVIDINETGQNIKWLMKCNGLTVRDIQEYLGFATPQSIYHWFNGRNLPTIDNLYALSALFHVPVDVILCGNRKETFASRYSYLYHLHIYYTYYEKILELNVG